MNCPSGKRTYESERTAVEALINARILYVNNKSCTVYQCHDCNQWHLTSDGNLHPDLAEFLNKNNVNRIREANHWEDKLK